MGQCTHSEHTQCVCVCECECVCVNTHCLEWTHMFTDFVSSYSLSDIYIYSKCLVPCIHLPICVYLSVCLSVYLPSCLYICLFVCKHLYLCLITTTYVCPSVSLFIHLSLSMSISVPLFIMTSVHPPLLSHSLCIPDSESLSLCHQHILQTKLYVC